RRRAARRRDGSRPHLAAGGATGRSALSYANVGNPDMLLMPDAEVGDMVSEPPGTLPTQLHVATGGAPSPSLQEGVHLGCINSKARGAVRAGSTCQVEARRGCVGGPNRRLST